MKSLSHAIHAVNDLDTTLAFYRDVFGIDGKATDFANPAVPLLTNAPGVTLRLSMLTLPGGTRFELTHFKGLERQPGASQVHGSRCGERRPLRARSRRAGGRREESRTRRSSRPAAHPSRSRPRTASALDRAARPGRLLLAARRRRPPPPARRTAQYTASSLAFTMEDAAATQRFYTGMMAVAARAAPTAFGTRRGAGQAVRRARERRVPQAQPARCRPAPPSSSRSFAACRARKFHLRVRDPGAPAMAINVDNIEGMVAQMKAAGVNLDLRERPARRLRQRRPQHLRRRPERPEPRADLSTSTPAPGGCAGRSAEPVD